MVDSVELMVIQTNQLRFCQSSHEHVHVRGKYGHGLFHAIHAPQVVNEKKNINNRSAVTSESRQ